eukprot:5296231-Amphidinium_carterae.1
MNTNMPLRYGEKANLFVSLHVTGLTPVAAYEQASYANESCTPVGAFEESITWHLDEKILAH